MIFPRCLLFSSALKSMSPVIFMSLFIMARTGRSISILEEKVISKIYLIRDKKVMLDLDLAEMYAVETKQLKRQIKRNAEQFPKDFMFVLKKKNLKT